MPVSVVQLSVATAWLGSLTAQLRAFSHKGGFGSVSRADLNDPRVALGGSGWLKPFYCCHIW